MKYWAVKLPKEHRGVYSKKEVIKEKQLLLQGLKGVEVKSFNTNKGQSLEEALKWAGVSGISDGDSMPVPSLNSKKNTQIKKKTELEEIVDEISKTAGQVISIFMTNGIVYKLTIRDCWYMLGGIPEEYGYTYRTYCRETGLYKNDINYERIKYYAKKAYKLPKSKIIYKENFIIIDNYDLDGPILGDKLDSCHSLYKHEENKPIALNTAHIQSIKPSGYWTLDNRSLYNHTELLDAILKVKNNEN